MTRGRKILLRISLVLGVLILLGAGAVIAATQFDDDDPEGTASETQLEPSGRLSEAPEPLTPADVNAYPAGSPRRAVLQLLFWAQWGNLPGLIDAYHLAVVNNLGVSQITGPYAWLRPQLASQLPRFVSVVSQGNREVLVTVDLLSEENAPQRELFRLKREGNDWKILFDTLLERGLRGYTAYRNERNLNDEKTGTRAQQKGEEAAQQYRDVNASIEALQAQRAAGQ